MKFKEMDEHQREAFKDAYVAVLSVKSQEEQQYTQQFFRLLILGNGGGIVLLATFMGALVQNKDRLHLLRTPLVAFAIGTFLAALMYVPLMTVSNQATNFVFNQVTEFFLNKRDVSEMTGYGFSCGGRVVMFGLMFLSLAAFAVGVFLCISVVGKLS